MIKQRSTKKTQSRFSTAAGLGIALLAASGQISAQDVVEDQAAPVQSRERLHLYRGRYRIGDRGRLLRRSRGKMARSFLQ